MYRFYLAAIDMLPAVLILAPVYWLLNRVYFHSTGKSLFCFLFACYLSVVYVLVGLPNVTYIRPEVNLNLIPFVGMIADLKNSILNILLFVPLGVMLPLLCSRFSIPSKTVLFGFGMSMTIELLQMLTFRATDVNDLITNTLGTYVGFLCAKVMQKSLRPAGKGSTGELALVFSSVLPVMFFGYPFVSSALWNFIPG